MTISIHDRWTDLLLSLPETGMGYQIVEVREPGRPPIPGLVLNGVQLVERLGLPMVVRERPALGEADRLGRILRSAPQEVELKVLRAGEGASERGRSGGAADSEPESSRPVAKFLRYSAFLNDRRILSDGSLLPGTYATTWEDGRAFELKPPMPVVIRKGNAQPAYGQPGGGIEVIFDSGSPPKTLIGHRELPQ